jgi:O-Antigen ligase
VSDTALAYRAGAVRTQGRITSAAPASHTRDAFPHTRRPLPWLLAGFLAMLFFVPIATTELKIHLPVDSRIDRFAVVVLIAAWLWCGGDQRAFLRTPRSKLFVSAALAFLVLALASLLLDVGRIVNLGDFKLAEKRFALLGSFLIVSWFALVALRYEDVRGFATYLIGLATMMSIGMLIERHTGYNVFYEWSRVIFGMVAHVGPSPTDIHPAFGSEGRVVVVGPTQHGLAAATMLVVVMPFALVRVFDATTGRSRWLNAVAFALMVAGAMATDRKTALVAAVAVMLYIAVYRPRQMLRLAPVGLVALVLVVHVASPGALGTALNVTAAANSNSTTHRVGDFENVAPDVLAHPLLGRGFGTLDPEQPSQFRINDDEYVDELWQVGFLGLAAFLWMILSPVLLARAAIRTRELSISSLALATSGGCIAFLVVCALFDALSFPQAPYMFFVVAALTTVAAAGPEGNVVPLRELAVARSAGGRLRSVARA